MRVEMRPGEQELLREMLGGSITPAAARLFARLREKLLLVGHNYDMQKEVLALVAVFADAASAYQPERPEPAELAEVLNQKDPTPLDEINVEERELIEADNATLQPDATGGAYKGNRIKWATVFKSTPKTPISKLEKGRPINYKSPRDRKWHAGRFVRINKDDKKLANIESSEMKKVFPVPICDIEVTDLSRPSTEPLPVQI